MDLVGLSGRASPQYVGSRIGRTLSPGNCLKAVPERKPGAMQLELWNYSPALVPGARLVDLLSLLFSLQSVTDDRVSQALAELEGHLPW